MLNLQLCTQMHGWNWIWIQESRAIASRTARCCWKFKFPYVSNFTTASYVLVFVCK